MLKRLKGGGGALNGGLENLGLTVLSVTESHCSGGPMNNYNRKLIEKFKRRNNRSCFYHN